MRDRIKYTDKGYFLCARKWLAGELAKKPSAFTIYFHLMGWANYQDGKLNRGEVAIGERDFAQYLEMSVSTVRKWLRWLRDRGWIEVKPVRWGAERGTVVRLLFYQESQDRRNYELPTKDQEMLLTPAHSEDQKMILDGVESEDQKTILTSTPEDQKMELNPRFEDQKMIPHIRNKIILRSESEVDSDAPSQMCPNGQIGDGGEKGIDLTVDPFQEIAQRALRNEQLRRTTAQKTVIKGEECNSHAHAPL